MSERDPANAVHGMAVKMASGKSVPAAFEQAVRAYSERVALRCGRDTLTYAALDARANAIASGLIARGVTPGSLVGLFMGRSIDTVAAILGVLKAGAAYVPFDPAYPAAQLAFILDDAAPAVILTTGAMQALPAASVFAARATLDLARDFPPVTTAPALPAITPDALAYVMYTSGSTGRPKGVQIPHSGILRLVIDNDFATFGADETVLHLAPLAFDASTFELWAALLHGGSLAIVPDAHPSLADIARAIREHGVTTAWLTAGLFHLMVDHQIDALRGLRQLLAGGDVLSVAHVDRLLAAHPTLRLVNGYGPTENTTFSCCYTIPPIGHGDRQPGPIPIGRAIRHSEAWVLDAALQPVPDGSDGAAGDMGELFVGGPGLARGYLNRPELDLERFIPHPFDPTPGARLYRTGDLVRRRADGVLEFHGRADRQVKINGKRVELDEIEAVLRRHPSVREAAVKTFEPVAGDRRIAAFVTAGAGGAIDLDALRGFVRAELPDYMQPAQLLALEAFPLTTSGKVDRAKLAVPDAAPSNPARAAAGNALEASLLRVWREVLGSDDIGVDDNFFDIGGSSLQMMKVHAAIQPLLPRPASIVDLFTYPRIRLLANWLANATPAAAPQASAAMLNAQERARRQNAALARARPAPRPTVR